ncbi:hypothetical protein N206_03540 [Helicobacter pylori UM111]|nr:hypothetical protein N206_03540 [Helicobacter pylori UM111]
MVKFNALTLTKALGCVQFWHSFLKNGFLKSHFIVLALVLS